MFRAWAGTKPRRLGPEAEAQRQVERDDDGIPLVGVVLVGDARARAESRRRASLGPMTPSMAGYSGTPLLKKLGIKEGMRVALLHAPEGIEATLGDLPAGVTLQQSLRRNDRVDLIVGFVTERAHLERNIGWLVTTLPPAGAFWVAWPKRASKMPTDMTEDVVREVALPMGWVDTKVCAIDEIWSGLKLVLRKELRPTARA